MFTSKKLSSMFTSKKLPSNLKNCEKQLLDIFIY